MGARDIPGRRQLATWERGTERSALLASLLAELECGAARTVAFVVPAGASWPMDAYELALIAARAAERAESGIEIALLTGESAPLASLGPCAAEAIAAEAGADVTPAPWSRVLDGIIVVPPRFSGPGGTVWLEDSEPVTHCLWWPPGHVAGRYLAQYIAARDGAVRVGLRWHPAGVPVAARVEDDAAVEWTPRSVR